MEYDIADAGMTAKCTRCPTLFRIPGGTAVGINKALSHEYRRKYAKLVQSTAKAPTLAASEVNPIFDYVVDESYSRPFRMNLADHQTSDFKRLIFGGICFSCLLVGVSALLMFASMGSRAAKISFGKWNTSTFAETKDEEELKSDPVAIPRSEPNDETESESGVSSSTPENSRTKRVLSESDDLLRRTGNLIKNGSFELPRVPSSESSIEVQSKRGDLPSWKVGRLAVEIFDGDKHQEPAHHGNQFLDLDGSIGAGEVSQSFVTEKGVLYELSFLYSTSPGTQSVGTVSIQSGDENLVPKFQVKSAIPNLSSWTWQLFRTEFRGNGQSATLTITSRHELESQNGLSIDDICVSPWKP